MYVVGLTGKKRAGKDFFGQKILEGLSGNSVTGNLYILHFATPLKQIANILLEGRPETIASWVAEFCNYAPFDNPRFQKRLVSVLGNVLNKHPQFRELEDGKPRKLLQYLGTDLFRKIDQDFWIRAMRTRLQGAPGTCKIVIVPDVRFPNEAHLCNYIVRVHGGVGGDAHASENQDLRHDYFIVNEPLLSASSVDNHVKEICRKVLTNGL